MRLFVATTFPAEILRDLNARIRKETFPNASWVRPETQHLTFAFLGEQDETVVEKIRIEPGEKFEASLRGCGFFSQRVGWVGVEPREAFVALAQRVRSALKAAHVDFDEKPFNPHLTLVRVRDRWPPSAIEQFEKALADYRSAPFTVGEVTLFSSKLSPHGATHTPLRTFPLG